MCKVTLVKKEKKNILEIYTMFQIFTGKLKKHNFHTLESYTVLFKTSLETQLPGIRNLQGFRQSLGKKIDAKMPEIIDSYFIDRVTRKIKEHCSLKIRIIWCCRWSLKRY